MKAFQFRRARVGVGSERLDGITTTTRASAAKKTSKLWKWRCWSLAAVAGLTVVSILFGFGLVAGVVDKDAASDSSMPSIKSPPRHVSSPANDASSIIKSNSAAADNSNQLHILFMFTNVYRNPSLQRQFTICIKSLFQHLSLPPDKNLSIHFVADPKSKEYAQEQLQPYKTQHDVHFVFHDSDEITQKIFPIVEEMQRRFSSGKNSYYGASIFFLSLGMHRVFVNIEKLVQLDFDLLVHTNIAELFDEFDKFDSSQMIGLGPEMQPVYRHVLHQYRRKRPDTRAGSPLSEGGLPGFNSGVMLLDLKKMRQSELYNSIIQNATNVETLVTEFGFKGHLGDQDLFTLLSFAHEELFYLLDCTWNYQLCTWWRDVGRQPRDIFVLYQECNSTSSRISHGNCDTPIPGSEQYVVGTNGGSAKTTMTGGDTGTTTQKKEAVVKAGGRKESSKVSYAIKKKPTTAISATPKMSTATRLPKTLPSRTTNSSMVLHLAVVACGVDRLAETLVMLKSVVVLTSAPLEFHIFADSDLRPLLQQDLDTWPAVRDHSVTVTYYPISYPGVEKQRQWIKLFKPCASQRLFLPYLINSTDRIVYVDTDTLFLRPLVDLWSFFEVYDEHTLATLAPEHEEAWMSWYKRFARHPYVEPYGVNSGVMLMDLQRMRDDNWLEKMVEYRANYTVIPWGDQDLINIYFHFQGNKLNTMSCQWNYRPDHCKYGENCKAAEAEGAFVLHGNRLAFHDGKFPSFKAAYDVFESFEFGQELQKHLVEPLRAKLNEEESTESNCGKVPDVFTKRLGAEVVDS